MGRNSGRDSETGAIIIEGHVQGLSNLRTLGAQGIPAYVIDRHPCPAKYSRYCKKFFSCPAFDSNELADFLEKLAEEEKIHGWILLPSNDHAVLTISRNAEKLRKHYRFAISPISILENIYDKIKLLDTAKKLGIPVPRYLSGEPVGTISDKLKFPVITKGRSGLSFYKRVGKKAILSNNPDELDEQLLMLSDQVKPEDTFTQEIIPSDGSNPTISFTAFAIGGLIKAYWTGQKIREHPTRFGTATFCESIEDPGLYSYSKKLLEKFKYTGICEVEFLFDPRDQRYKLIEINARTWLWVGLANACGIDFASLLFNYLSGIKNDFPKSYTTGNKWVNLLTDLPFSFLSILKGELSIKKYFRSFKGRISFAIFSWQDLLPVILFPVLILLYSMKRRKMSN